MLVLQTESVLMKVEVFREVFVLVLQMVLVLKTVEGFRMELE